MRYIDLMGGTKPHLLVKSVNNIDAETEVHYAPSTEFYLRDKRAGQPWVTRLPFPVHVVDRVVTNDRISGNRFVTRYAYHHGYFDGKEREFRGFGMVERWDTEEFRALAADGQAPAGANIDASLYLGGMMDRFCLRVINRVGVVDDPRGLGHSRYAGLIHNNSSS